MKTKPRKPGILAKLAAKKAYAEDTAKYVLVLAPHLCLVELKAANGKADQESWYGLNFRLVYGLELARHFFQNEALVQLYQALRALTKCHAHEAGREGQWYVTPEEAADLAVGLTLTDEMESMCSPWELHRAAAAASQQLGLV